MGGEPKESGASGKSKLSNILQTEPLLIQMIVRHGEKVMCEVQNNQGEPQSLTVVEYVQYSLEQDGLQMRGPLHHQILEEALERFKDEGFRCDRYFENHPDVAIADLANALAHEPETLSRVYSKESPVKKEDERLVELLPHVMADYKLAVVEDELRDIMQQMRSPEVLVDKERSIEVMKRFQEIKQIQSALGRQRGDRVLM